PARRPARPLPRLVRPSGLPQGRTGPLAGTDARDRPQRPQRPAGAAAPGPALIRLEQTHQLATGRDLRRRIFIACRAIADLGDTQIRRTATDDRDEVKEHLASLAKPAVITTIAGVIRLG